MNKKIKNLIIFFTLMLIFMPIFTGCVESDRERRERLNKERIEKEEKKEAEERAKDLEITATYKKACREFDFLTAHECLDKLQAKYLSLDYSNHSQRREDIPIAEKNFFAAVAYVYKQELTYLFNSDESNIDKKIMLMLSDFPIFATCPSEGFKGPLWYKDELAFNIQTYTRSAETFNNLCDVILEHCIEIENKDLAFKIIKKYMSVPVRIDGQPGVVREGIKFNDYTSYIRLDNKSQREAQKKYNSAFN